MNVYTKQKLNRWALEATSYFPEGGKLKIPAPNSFLLLRFYQSRYPWMKNEKAQKRKVVKSTIKKIIKLDTSVIYYLMPTLSLSVLYKDTCIPGANMMQDTTRVNNNSRPYITLEAVEF